MDKQQLDWLQQQFPFIDYQPLPEFGSMRRFYRLINHTDSRIVIEDHHPEQLGLFLEQARLFQTYQIPIPQIFAFSSELHLILEEDLGTCTLEQWYRQNDTIEAAYQCVIDHLIGWQQRVAQQPIHEVLPDYTVAFARSETRYFVCQFLGRYLQIPRHVLRSFDGFFDQLAQTASQLPSTLMHRDFQSQNIMWQQQQPVFIDFQSAMRGPYTYDLASLLLDNYVSLTATQQDSLQAYFFQAYPQQDSHDFSIAALQRICQALGAYAFLSLERGKTQYLQYIPRGLENLQRTLVDFPELQSLQTLIAEYFSRSSLCENLSS